MLDYAYNWTGILIVVCFVSLMIFDFSLIIFLHYRYQSKIKSFQTKAFSADRELQASRKKYNQAWVIIHNQQKTIKEQKRGNYLLSIIIINLLLNNQKIKYHNFYPPLRYFDLLHYSYSNAATN